VIALTLGLILCLFIGSKGGCTEKLIADILLHLPILIALPLLAHFPYGVVAKTFASHTRQKDHTFDRFVRSHG